MKKIFKEYGGIIIVVIAIVALIGLVGALMQPGGVMDGAFSNVVQSFVDKADEEVANSTQIKNYFDGHLWTYGSYIDPSSGNEVAVNVSSVSDYIDVSPGESYILQCDFNSDLNKRLFSIYYNSQKEKIISKSFEFNYSNTWAFTVPEDEDISFVRFMLYRDPGSEDALLPVDTKLHTVTDLQTRGFNFAGKKILNLGDSIAAGDMLNDNCRSYAYQIADNNYMHVYNQAVGGATIRTVDGNNNNVLSQVTKADASLSPDFILLNGLTNDAFTSVTSDPTQLGAVSNGFNVELDTSTFCGAFETILKNITEKWPSANVIYTTPHVNGTRDVAAQDILVELALEMCEKWNIHVVDIYHDSGFSTFDSNQSATYSIDGCHPNRLGYQTYYVPFIEAKMHEILD